MLLSDLPAEPVSVHDWIELPEAKPVVEQHLRLAVTCPGCRARVSAPWPDGIATTPFGPRLHATAVYLKTFQALSYERLQRVLSDLFGLKVSQGGLMNMLRRAEARFDAGRDAALAALRLATVVASDETSVRIEGSNSSYSVSIASRPWCTRPPRHYMPEKRAGMACWNKFARALLSRKQMKCAA